eukprot:3705261-Pleurochrysis_carterae.AAC.1
MEMGWSSMATSSSWVIGDGPGAGGGVMGSGTRAASAPARISLSRRMTSRRRYEGRPRGTH